MASLDGNLVFGIAVKIMHQPNANASQVNAFFGVQGVQSMDGGARGRAFFVEGLLVGDFPNFVVLQEVGLQNYADGLTHTLVDTTGTVWQNIVYRNEYQRSSNMFLFLPGLNSWSMPYKLVLHGLT